MKYCFALLLLVSCAANSTGPRQFEPEIHQASIQGFVGVMDIEDQDYDLDSNIADDIESDVDTLPTLGFVLQKTVVGERFQLGFEGGMSVAWESDTARVNVNGGTIIVADNDLFLGDAFVGVHASLPIGSRARFYAGLGPLLQFANVSLEYDDNGTRRDFDESGVGSGGYARVGFEYEFSQGTRLGIFVRRVDSTVDLGGDIDEVDLEGTQLVFAATQLL